jgi:hypothetical protein
MNFPSRITPPSRTQIGTKFRLWRFFGLDHLRGNLRVSRQCRSQGIRDSALYDFFLRQMQTNVWRVDEGRSGVANVERVQLSALSGRRECATKWADARGFAEFCWEDRGFCRLFLIDEAQIM